MKLSTPILTAGGLISHIRDYVASAWEPDLRYSGDDDAVLLGKLRMLGVLAESLLDGIDADIDDERQLLAAIEELDAAEKHLMSRIANAPVKLALANSLPAAHGETPPPVPLSLEPRQDPHSGRWLPRLVIPRSGSHAAVFIHEHGTASLSRDLQPAR